MELNDDITLHPKLLDVEGYLDMYNKMVMMEIIPILIGR